MPNADWAQMRLDDEPLIIVGGQGVRVTDSEGNRWIDVNGGYASVNVGYGRQDIANVVYEQMQQIAYFPQQTVTPPTVRLAAKLAEITPGSLSRTFLVTGGSEANETALKIARAYHHRCGEPGRYKIISRKGSYHGATGGVLWMGADEGKLADYEPPYPGLLYAPQPNTYRCEFNSESADECATRCAHAIEQLILTHGPSTVAAVIAEPIAGGPGTAVPGHPYWPMVREICDRYGILLIVDEVVTGFGRTGKLFAVEHWDVVPDIMTVAKGLCSTYIPLGAAIIRREIGDKFSSESIRLNHVFTASGHPISSVVGLKNIEIVQREGLLDNALRVGDYFKDQLYTLQEKHPMIGDVRGIGLMLSMEFVANRQTKERFCRELKVAQRLTTSFKKRGLLLRAHGNTIVNIMPPLCITRQEAAEIILAVDESLNEVESAIGLT